ncbi:MAG: acetate--CoA ligase family protein [Deltaproteobacteria bacterium]|nr:acetate--CoA ligase family protein [Deltaproteobacteria bacterium]
MADQLEKQARQSAFRDVEPILRPRSITLVGASERADSWPARIFRNLRSYGYPGEIHLVNPRHRELYGAPCYPSIQAVPGEVDQIIVIVPGARVAAVFQEAGARGCRSAVVFSGGFSESNTSEGLAAEREMIAAAERFGILICGPNCLGNFSTRERVLTLAEQGVESFGTGGLALISQSSGLMGGLARHAHSRGIGMSYGIASGSEANVDAADYVNFLVEDESTRVIGVILEAIRRPAEFALACERARDAKKPLLVLKIGKSRQGQEAAFTHTGALAGSYEAFRAFSRRCGIIEIGGLDELIDTAEIFLRCGVPAAAGVAAIALSGGARGYIHDLGEELGIDFPPLHENARLRLGQLLGVGAGVGNPLDLGAAGASNPDVYIRCLDLLGSDPAVGLVVFQGELPHTPEFAARAAGYQRMVERARQMGKSLVFFSRACHSVSDYGAQFRDKCKAPFLQDIRKSVQAVGHVVDFVKSLEAPGTTHQREHGHGFQTQDPVTSACGLDPGLALSDRDAFKLLEDEGIRIARYGIANTAEGAREAAGSIGYPVALKVSMPGLTHKSETGGVRLGLSQPAEVVEAFDSIQRGIRAGADTPVQVLVQEMVRGPLELYIGGRWDPELGPLVTLGLGGLFVEAIGRVASSLAPVTPAEAEGMLDESGVSRALRRLRVDQATCRAEIVNTIVKFSGLVANHREIQTLEINPLVIKDDGFGVAVDAVALRRE